MNNSEKTGCWYSWPVIIIALCFFWPVGLFLLIKRVVIDKKAALLMGKLVGVLGVVCYFIAALGLVVCISEGFAGDDVFIMIFFAVLGVVLSAVAKRVKKNVHIDGNAGAVISPDGTPISSDPAGAVSKQAKIVHCPYCGANSTIYGNVGECEYCGSPLQ